MPFIHIEKDNGRTADFSITQEQTTIGRDEDNNIVLSDFRASRKHAKIVKKKKGFYLTDLGSFNGTLVNKKSINSVKLKDNDEIQIGQSKLRFTEKNKQKQPHTDTLSAAAKNGYKDWPQQTMQITSKDDCEFDSQKLLISLESQDSGESSVKPAPSNKSVAQSAATTDLSTLERMNKVLFVLYEVSRQLNTIHDFNELLKKIMDLIFMVIDADYGFVILTGDETGKELIPVVMKSKHEREQDKKGMKASRTIINKVALLTSNAMADSRLAQTESLIQKQTRSAMCVPLWEKDKIIGAIQLDSTRLDNQFSKDDLELLKSIGCQMAMIIGQARLNKQIQEEERMRNRLERFHSPQIIEMILKGNQETIDNIMEPKDLTSTILFTDIVEFTGLSEKMPPREINMILNQHFSQLTDIIFEHDGTLDKFLGDGLMAIFGAPMEKKDDAVRAVKAAQIIRREFKHVMKEINPKKKFNIRIGVNTGRVVAGNIGSPKRMDYTVIGDPVNTAKRLESIAQPNQILIGPETYKRVKGKFNINKIGPQKLKGKSTAIMAYEVLD